MKHTDWDRRLGIRTEAGDYEKQDANHSPYEPTAYAVLQRLAESGHIRREHTLVDYGCGKGRVGFYLHHVLGCRTIGVDYDPRMIACAQENLVSYAGRKNGEGAVSFVCNSAENYRIGEADCFYFFNPFPEKTLRIVIRRIFEACYAGKGRKLLVFYFPLDAYLSCLMTEARLRLIDEIDCRDLFPGTDSRERMLVFEAE